jgi:sugar phosphate isomerase/epimerase
MNRFGISTHLFHEHRLSREHLVHIAAHGFEAIELFATRAHFDYHDAQAAAALAEWLADTRLELHSLHAPIVKSLKGGRWVDPFSNASRDETSRKTALQETDAAIALARLLPYRFLVVHLGTPTTERVAPNDNQPELARRTVEELVEKASHVNVKITLEVIPNSLSSATSLVHLIEEELDGIDVGICLDYGHAHLMGDLGEAIETVSGHL